MALPVTSSLAFSTINSVFQWGSAMSQYAGRTYYKAGGAGTFPASNFSMSIFSGAAPTDEWNCACVSLCACSSDCSACSK